ncbi:unnamed protein product [Ilex paraguariensis]|uniref:Uncharacterized protein n=1 Tax=Ilex paraguariensis TaxID=185542 RepID=A0ABC8TH08_9AQUA
MGQWLGNLLMEIAKCKSKNTFFRKFRGNSYCLWMEKNDVFTKIGEWCSGLLQVDLDTQEMSNLLLARPKVGKVEVGGSERDNVAQKGCKSRRGSAISIPNFLVLIPGFWSSVNSNGYIINATIDPNLELAGDISKFKPRLCSGKGQGSGINGAIDGSINQGLSLVHDRGRGRGRGKGARTNGQKYSGIRELRGLISNVNYTGANSRKEIGALMLFNEDI